MCLAYQWYTGSSLEMIILVATKSDLCRCVKKYSDIQLELGI